MNLSIDEAVKKAIDYCIDHDILKEFLEERGNEVLHVMTFDCTFEAREKLWKEQEEMMSKQIDDLSLQNNEKEKQIDDLSLQINEKGKQIDDLSSKNNEQARLIESLQEQIKTLQASTES